MDQYKFTNRVWITEKGRKLDKFLFVCGCIGLFCNLILFLMDGVKEISIISVIFMMIMVVWSKSNMKRMGRYVNSECILSFSKDLLIWEYPQLDTGDGKSAVYEKYTITKESIIDIAMCSEMQSIRLECRPVIESVNQKGKATYMDCARKNNPCVLIMYDNSIEHVQYLIAKHLNMAVNIVD